MTRWTPIVPVQVIEYDDGRRIFSLRLSEEEARDLASHLEAFTTKTTGATDSRRLANVRGIAAQLGDALADIGDPAAGDEWADAMARTSDPDLAEARSIALNILDLRDVRRDTKRGGE